MRALILYASGSITVESLATAKTKGSKNVKFPDTIIQPFTTRDKEMGRTWTSSFSAIGWSESTRKMLKLCTKQVSDDAMDRIIQEAKKYSKASRHQAKETDSDSDVDPDDSILNLADGVLSDDGL